MFDKAKFLSGELTLDGQAGRVRRCEIEGIGETYFLRLGPAERMQYQSMLQELDPDEEARARSALLSLTFVNKDGSRIFSDEDAARMGGADGPYWNALVTEAFVVNGFGSRKDAKKNSEATTS